jgi:hypothetical protein
MYGIMREGIMGVVFSPALARLVHHADKRGPQNKSDHERDPGANLHGAWRDRAERAIM